ncbi:TetR/AcrR family transcriptional regulator [Cupriavidus numazuensis]|uniref:HTH tetR-type domain-containing protein n=1 Tax=Cupriavidus numazuensis TaxID=221992 RepID=A0ABN7QG78_9BURK|nr:TetR/AcrR family transcriptional regulator [Cupriavidus numazuensis]CAG2161217.1 hypothetical protein LMG26411_08078 [Cupriavidus numazuensis]
MKVTKEKALENRTALIEAAARLFAEKGIDGVGVAEVAKVAGLTHGALYAQFPSKSALAAEALAFGAARGNGRIAALADPTALARGLGEQLDYYLSEAHRDAISKGCAMAASASEAARQAPEVRAQFCDGFNDLVRIVESMLDAPAAGSDRHSRALVIVSAMIGALAVSRAASGSHPQLSNDVLTASRSILGELGGAEPARASTTGKSSRKKSKS